MTRVASPPETLNRVGDAACAAPRGALRPVERALAQRSDAIAKLRRAYAATRFATFVLIGIAVVVAIGAMRFVLVGVARPLAALVTSMNPLGEGDP